MKRFKTETRFSDGSSMVEDIKFPSIDWFLCRLLLFLKNMNPQKFDEIAERNDRRWANEHKTKR